MFEIKQVAIVDIVIPNRIRPVDEDHAKIIAASIADHGLINPITIRSTPNAKDGKYTLVAGAHRLRACVLNDAETIDAVIVKADQTAATILEVSENLFRNELSVIDRAAFVQTLRDLYEQEHGEIKSGRPDNRVKFTLLMEGGFSKYVADRLGLSVEAIKLLNRISQKLSPALRDELRHTPIADNQSQLLKLAKMEQTEQQRTVIALKETDGDLKKALELVEGKDSDKKPNLQAVYLSKAIEAVSKMTPETFAKFEVFLADRKSNEAVV